MVGLLDVVVKHQPQAIVIAMGSNTPIFRCYEYPGYKGVTDPEKTIFGLMPAKSHLYALLQALNLQIVNAAGYEGDDVLATLALVGSAEGYRVKVLTGDQDLFAVVDDSKNISVLYQEGYRAKVLMGITKVLAPSEFCEAEVIDRLGVAPVQVTDYKALCGDPSDNIPGVKGIGRKTAANLLNSYGSLDNIYASLGNIKGAVKDKLVAGQSSAYLFQRLVQLRTDILGEVKAVRSGKTSGVRLEDCLVSKCRLLPVPCVAFEPWDFDDVDLVLTSAGGAISRIWAHTDELWGWEDGAGDLAWRRVPESEREERAALLSAELGVHDSCAVGWVVPAIVNLLSCLLPLDPYTAAPKNEMH